jgi:undecaprenyl-diphosphatase
MWLTHTDLLLAEHANRFAAHHDGWEDVARSYAGASEPLFVAGVVALIGFGLVARRRRLLEAGVLALTAAGAALVIGALVSHLVDRSRPFVAHHQIHAFLTHAADPGFPSDHATAAFAIASVLVLRLGWPGVPVLVAALAIACSRVLLGLHYPGDVLAGALIGTLCAVALCTAVAVLRPGARPRRSLHGLHPAPR